MTSSKGLIQFLNGCEAWLQDEGVLQEGIEEPLFKMAADRIQELEAELSGVHAGTHAIVPVEPTAEMITHAATMRMLQERDVHIVYLEMVKVAQGNTKPISTDLGFMLSEKIKP